MFRQFTSCAAAATIAAFFSIAPGHAAIYPAVHYAAPSIQHVDCAVGLHIGPAGACVIGTDDHVEHHEDRVIEHRSADEGCHTKTVHKENGAGDSETKTKSNCD